MGPPCARWCSTSEAGVTDATANEGFKAVQIGGPSGGCLTVDHLDLAARLRLAAQCGRHGRLRWLVVMNEQTCMVEHRPLLHAVHTERILRQVRRMPRGHQADARPPRGDRRGPGHARDVGSAREWWPARCRRARSAAWARRHPTRCSRRCGISAPSTRRTSYQKRCPAGQCKALLVPTDRPGALQGVHASASRSAPSTPSAARGRCPTRSICEKCIRCGVCAESCKFGAVTGF
jgi:NADH-quinone oxidoreductase subunit F